jgi:hypothetical protein
MAINYSQNVTFNGLGTFSFNIPAAGAYFLDGKISIPTIVNGGGPSSLVVTINQNGSPVYVGLAGAEGFYAILSCAANDLIAVVFSSAAPADQALNVIKSTFVVSQGV